MTKSQRKLRNRPKVVAPITTPPIAPRGIPDTRWWMGRWAICLFLAALTAAVYSPVRSYPFIDYDDPAYVVDNSHVQAGMNWDTVSWALTTTEQTNWHPLTWLSHSLDCQLFGLNPGAHHVTNVVLHLVNVLLLFLLLERVTGAVGCSYLVAALFALHPFNVDSVAWIAERKNMLSTMFFLLTLGAYGWYARKPDWKRYALVTVLFILGLSAKPMLVTLPFVLLLLDYWPLQRIAGLSQKAEQFPVPQFAGLRLLIEKLPLFAISLASCAVTVIAQQDAIKPRQSIPYADRLANAVASYALYVSKTFWPSGFAVFHPHLFDETQAVVTGLESWVAVIAGVLLLTVGSAIIWSQRKRRPYLVTGWAWYLGTLVPVIGIIQVGLQGMADRYAYLPLIGIFIIAAWGMNEVADHFQMKPIWREIVTVAMIAALSLLTVRQVHFWRTDEVLWLHALEVSPDSYFINDRIGNRLASAHRPEALKYFEQAARIAPLDPTSHGALAAHLQDQGRLKEAIQDYEVVVGQSDEAEHVVFAYTNLCIIFGELGDYSKAHEAFARAMQKDPQQTDSAIRSLAAAVSAR